MKALHQHISVNWSFPTSLGGMNIHDFDSSQQLLSFYDVWRTAAHTTRTELGKIWCVAHGVHRCMIPNVHLGLFAFSQKWWIVEDYRDHTSRIDEMNELLIQLRSCLGLISMSRTTQDNEEWAQEWVALKVDSNVFKKISDNKLLTSDQFFLRSVTLNNAFNFLHLALSESDTCHLSPHNFLSQKPHHNFPSITTHPLISLLLPPELQLLPTFSFSLLLSCSHNCVTLPLLAPPFSTFSL